MTVSIYGPEKSRAWLFSVSILVRLLNYQPFSRAAVHIIDVPDH